MATALSACSKPAPTIDTTTSEVEVRTEGNAAAEQAASQIQDDYMRGIVAEISDDRYEGRGPGTRGDDAARQYLVEQMEALGLQPGAANGSWQQAFDLVGINASQPETWTFAGHDKSLTLKQWDEFIVGSGVQAARQGAAGAIIIHTSPSAGYPFQVVKTSWTGVQFELPAGDEPRSQISAWVTEDSARDLVAMAGFDLDQLREAAFNRDFEPVPLGITTSIDVAVELQRVQSANVLGLIEGSDPDLRDEVVIYTAHHDHLGIGTPDEDGDAIYNGAMDNATGVAQVMAIAKAIKALPKAPRRSVLIALVGAEEQGLLGSEYYAANPTFAPGRIAANLNYDGGNIWGDTHDVTYIGLGKSSIDQIMKLIADEQGRVVKPDQFADKGYFYRSDQFSFAKIGVPAMYLDTGTDFVDRPPGWGKQQLDHYTEVNYHQPTDEYDPGWNLEGMIDDALLGYWTGLAIANADEIPTWNPGDEFEAARLKALDAVRQ